MPHLKALVLTRPICYRGRGPRIITQGIHYEPNFTVEWPSVALSTNPIHQLGPAPFSTMPFLSNAQVPYA